MRYCDWVLYTVDSEFQDDIGNPGPGLGQTDRHKYMAGLNWLMGSQFSPSL